MEPAGAKAILVALQERRRKGLLRDALLSSPVGTVAGLSGLGSKPAGGIAGGTMSSSAKQSSTANSNPLQRSAPASTPASRRKLPDWVPRGDITRWRRIRQAKASLPKATPSQKELRPPFPTHQNVDDIMSQLDALRGTLRDTDAPTSQLREVERTFSRLFSQEPMGRQYQGNVPTFGMDTPGSANGQQPLPCSMGQPRFSLRPLNQGGYVPTGPAPPSMSAVAAAAGAKPVSPAAGPAGRWGLDFPDSGTAPARRPPPSAAPARDQMGAEGMQQVLRQSSFFVSIIDSIVSAQRALYRDEDLRAARSQNNALRLRAMRVMAARGPDMDLDEDAQSAHLDLVAASRALTEEDLAACKEAYEDIRSCRGPISLARAVQRHLPLESGRDVRECHPETWGRLLEMDSVEALAAAVAGAVALRRTARPLPILGAPRRLPYSTLRRVYGVHVLEPMACAALFVSFLMLQEVKALRHSCAPPALLYGALSYLDPPPTSGAFTDRGVAALGSPPPRFSCDHILHVLTRFLEAFCLLLTETTVIHACAMTNVAASERAPYTQPPYTQPPYTQPAAREAAPPRVPGSGPDGRRERASGLRSGWLNSTPKPADQASPGLEKGGFSVERQTGANAGAGSEPGLRDRRAAALAPESSAAAASGGAAEARAAAPERWRRVVCSAGPAPPRAADSSGAEEEREEGELDDDDGDEDVMEAFLRSRRGVFGLPSSGGAESEDRNMSIGTSTTDGDDEGYGVEDYGAEWGAGVGAECYAIDSGSNSESFTDLCDWPAEAAGFAVARLVDCDALDPDSSVAAVLRPPPPPQAAPVAAQRDLEAAAQTAREPQQPTHAHDEDDGLSVLYGVDQLAERLGNLGLSAAASVTRWGKLPLSATCEGGGCSEPDDLAVSRLWLLADDGGSRSWDGESEKSWSRLEDEKRLLEERRGRRAARLAEAFAEVAAIDVNLAALAAKALPRPASSSYGNIVAFGANSDEDEAEDGMYGCAAAAAVASSSASPSASASAASTSADLTVKAMAAAVCLLRPGLLEAHPDSWGRLLQVAEEEETEQVALVAVEEEEDEQGPRRPRWRRRRQRYEDGRQMGTKCLRQALVGLILLAHRPDLPLHLLRLVPCTAAGAVYEVLVVQMAENEPRRAHSEAVPCPLAHYHALTAFAAFNFLPTWLGTSSAASRAAPAPGAVQCSPAFSSPSEAAAATAPAPSRLAHHPCELPQPQSSIQRDWSRVAAVYEQSPCLWSTLAECLSVHGLAVAGLQPSWLVEPPASVATATTLNRAADSVTGGSGKGGTEQRPQAHCGGGRLSPSPSPSPWSSTSASACVSAVSAVSMELRRDLVVLAAERGPPSMASSSPPAAVLCTAPAPSFHQHGIIDSGGDDDASDSSSLLNWPTARQPAVGSPAAHLLSEGCGDLMDFVSKLAARGADKDDDDGLYRLDSDDDDDDEPLRGITHVYGSNGSRTGGGSGYDGTLSQLYAQERSCNGDAATWGAAGARPEFQFQIPRLQDLYEQGLPQLRGIDGIGGGGTGGIGGGIGGIGGGGGRGIGGIGLNRAGRGEGGGGGFGAFGGGGVGGIGGGGSWATGSRGEAHAGRGQPPGREPLALYGTSSEAATPKRPRQLGGDLSDPGQAASLLLEVWGCAADRSPALVPAGNTLRAKPVNVVGVGGPSLALLLLVIHLGDHCSGGTEGAGATWLRLPPRAVFQPSASERASKVALGPQWPQAAAAADLEGAGATQTAFPPPPHVPAVVLLTFRGAVAPGELSWELPALRQRMVLITSRNSFADDLRRVRYELVNQRVGILGLTAGGLGGIEAALLVLSRVRDELLAEERDLAVLVCGFDTREIEAVAAARIVKKDTNRGSAPPAAAATAAASAAGDSGGSGGAADRGCGGAEGGGNGEVHGSGATYEEDLRLEARVRANRELRTLYDSSVDRIRTGLSELYDLRASSRTPGLPSSSWSWDREARRQRTEAAMDNRLASLRYDIEAARRLMEDHPEVSGGVEVRLVVVECEKGRPEDLALEAEMSLREGRDGEGDGSTAAVAATAACSGGGAGCRKGGSAAGRGDCGGGGGRKKAGAGERRGSKRKVPGNRGAAGKPDAAAARGALFDSLELRIRRSKQRELEEAFKA